MEWEIQGRDNQGVVPAKSISHAHLPGNHLTIYKSMFKDNLNGPPRNSHPFFLEKVSFNILPFELCGRRMASLLS